MDNKKKIDFGIAFWGVMAMVSFYHENDLFFTGCIIIMNMWAIAQVFNTQFQKKS